MPRRRKPHHVNMTVGELRELLAGLDDSIPVLVPASDHSYRPASASDVTAVYDADWGWSEDFGDMNPDGITETDRKKALVVSGE